MNSAAGHVPYVQMAPCQQWTQYYSPLNTIPAPNSLYLCSLQPVGYYSYNYYYPIPCYTSHVYQVPQYQYVVPEAPGDAYYYRATPAYEPTYAETYYTYNQPSNDFQQSQPPLVQIPVMDPIPTGEHQQIMIQDLNQGGCDMKDEIIMSESNTEPEAVQGVQSQVVILVPPVQSNESTLLSTPAAPAVPAVPAQDFPELPVLSNLNVNVESGGKEEPTEVLEEPMSNDSNESEDSIVPLIDEGIASSLTSKGEPSEEASFTPVRAGEESEKDSVTPLADGEVLKSDKSDEENIKEIIDAIYKRATSASNSSVIYADLCQVTLGKNTEYHKLLLSRCQEELKRKKKLDRNTGRKQKYLDAAKQGDELDNEKIRTLKFSLNNMEFIAELFKRKLLPRFFLNSWIQELLVVTPTEENLESLCKLLSVAGKELQGESDQSRLDQCINMIKRIIQQRNTSPKLCDMLQDIVDLKQNNWIPSTNKQDNKPDMKVHKNQDKQEEENIKLPSNKNVLISEPNKNETVNASCPSNNKSQAVTPHDNQLGTSGKQSVQNRGSKRSRENHRTDSRRKYVNDHCYQNQGHFQRWERRDYGYRWDSWDWWNYWDGRNYYQPMYPRPQAQKHYREQGPKARRPLQIKTSQKHILQNQHL